MSFEGKSVVVMGSGAGMGEATAKEYGRRGAKVLVADIDASAANRVAEAIRGEGGTAEAHEMDLRSRADVFGTIDKAVGLFGGLNVLANVGAIYPNAMLDEMTEEFFDDMLAVDVKGPLFGCQAALPHLKKTHGAIVNVASGAAFYAIPGLAAYSAAKAALVALGRSVALEAGPTVRLNTVLPGPTLTQGAQAVAGFELPLLGRPLDPQEIADVIVWVSSDDASAVNGALLRVDAGHQIL
jgi:NAD(P)-dependent dehydrogenase (short-subunit alcohol dehydrogenase family)